MNTVTTTDIDATPGGDAVQPTAPLTSPPEGGGSQIPTWVWIVGGIVFVGIIGAVVWYFSTQSPSTQKNPMRDPFPRPRVRRRRRRGKL